MNMKQCFFALTLAFSSVSTTMADSLLGSLWVAVDEKSGEPRAEIQFAENKGIYSGTILNTFAQPGDTGICSKCPGNFKDKPIQGMGVVWGLHKEGHNKWENGQILDPRTGYVYRAKLLLKGDKLYVRGYLGVSLIGRTQIWERKKSS